MRGKRCAPPIPEGFRNCVGSAFAIQVHLGWWSGGLANRENLDDDLVVPVSSYVQVGDEDSGYESYWGKKQQKKRNFMAHVAHRRLRVPTI
ncbi:hypothetical protein OUZ56_029497 [Daphnia magna]|uniref:Uncharacterized protein n=1 Tax=Daphnia magna TaxID=35525 RepID=A0ABR0B6Z7_9CRUS|nr:hypothetical protein OUZ56_029497 [Daphnia magna]